jgi:Flp pilus assembly protein TadD
MLDHPTSPFLFVPSCKQERELGNDAFALQRWDSAVAHYSRAIQLCATDAALWSNRAAAYLAKGW